MASEEMRTETKRDVKLSAYKRTSERLQSQTPSWRFVVLFGLTAISCFALIGCAPTGEPTPIETVFYPPLPQRPRIQFLRTFGGAEDIEPPASALASFVVGQENEDPKLVTPSDENGPHVDSCYLRVFLKLID